MPTLSVAPSTQRPSHSALIAQDASIPFLSRALTRPIRKNSSRARPKTTPSSPAALRQKGKASKAKRAAARKKTRQGSCRPTRPPGDDFSSPLPGAHPRALIRRAPSIVFLANRGAPIRQTLGCRIESKRRVLVLSCLVAGRQPQPHANAASIHSIHSQLPTAGLLPSTGELSEK